MQADLLGHFLRVTPHFKGKWRLVRHWSRGFAGTCWRVARLPFGALAEVDLKLPFEQNIWLEREEWDELVLLNNLLGKGETFIDVGANIGTWSLVAAKIAGEDGKVLSVEPNPKTAERLRKNVELNSFGNVNVIEGAASDNEGTCFLTCPQEHNLASIVTEKDEGSLEVRSFTLDGVIDEVSITSVAGIKIDAEGHELEVLKGAEGLLSKFRPWMIVEFNTTFLPSSRLGDWNVLQLLKTIGYDPYVFPASSLKRLNLDWSTPGYCNILFLHELAKPLVFQ